MPSATICHERIAQAQWEIIGLNDLFVENQSTHPSRRLSTVILHTILLWSFILRGTVLLPCVCLRYESDTPRKEL